MDYCGGRICNGGYHETEIMGPSVIEKVTTTSEKDEQAVSQKDTISKRIPNIANDPYLTES